MRYAKPFFFFFLLFFFVTPLVQGLGISPAIKYYDYEPGFEVEETILLRSPSPQAESIKLEATGSLADYVEFSEAEIPGFTGTRTVTATISIPDQVEVGRQTLRIRALEQLDTNANFGSRIGVTSKLIIDFPYPGEYLRVQDLNVQSVNEGSSSSLSYNVKSLGQNTFTFNHKADILDSSGERVETYNLGTQTIATQEVLQGTQILNTQTYAPGSYTVAYQANWDTGSQKENRTLRIGQKNVALQNFTPKTLLPGSIQQVNITLENQWNGDIPNIYAVIDLNGTLFTTPTTTAEPFETLTLQQYVDTTGIQPGDLTVNLTVYYDQNSTSYNVPLSIENPLKPSNTTTYILVGAAILLLITTVSTYIYRAKHR